MTAIALAIMTAALAFGCRGAQQRRAAQPPVVAGTPGTSGSIQVGGLTRTYLVHAPRGHDRSRPAPLLLAFHGGRGQGKDMVDLTLGGFNALADREGFVAVYPDAIEANWNDGRNVDRFRSHRENINDLAFVAALIDRLAADYGIDRTRVYATGISNGGIFSYRLACEMSERITAIAPVAGSIAENVLPRCAPKRSIPVLAINSVSDPWLKWTGGEVVALGTRLGRVAPVPESVAFFARHNGCSAPPVTTEIAPAVDDGTRVKRTVYGGCRDGVEVVLYAVEGAGHTWPQGHQYAAPLIVGKTTKNLDANGVIWQFLKRYGLK